MPSTILCGSANPGLPEPVDAASHDPARLGCCDTAPVALDPEIISSRIFGLYGEVDTISGNTHLTGDLVPLGQQSLGHRFLEWRFRDRVRVNRSLPLQGTIGRLRVLEITLQQPRAIPLRGDFLRPQRVNQVDTVLGPRDQHVQAPFPAGCIQRPKPVGWLRIPWWSVSYTDDYVVPFIA